MFIITIIYIFNKTSNIGRTLLLLGMPSIYYIYIYSCTGKYLQSNCTRYTVYTVYLYITYYTILINNNIYNHTRM